MATGRADDRYSHFPKGDHYPPRWPAADAPEPTCVVIFGCGCARRFAAPLPLPGSALSCGIHGRVRVLSVSGPESG